MRSLELPGGGRVVFTAREHGNLSSFVGEAAADARQARERLRGKLGVEQLALARQVHGNIVHRVERLAPAKRVPGGGPSPVELDMDGVRGEADGQATAAPGVGVMVLVADCLPVALATSGAVAVVHAGWRGLAGGVLEEGLRALADLGGDGEISAVIGPGAGVCCYETGEEVHAAFGGAHRHGQNLDLRAIAQDRLRAAGVSEVQDLMQCTICDERMFSHRREGPRAGRQAVVAWLS
jgi:YfiH family protein